MEHLLFGNGVEAAAAVRQMMQQMGVAGAANANAAQRARFLWATMYAQDQPFKDFAPSQFGEGLGGGQARRGCDGGLARRRSLDRQASWAGGHHRRHEARRCWCATAS